MTLHLNLLLSVVEVNSGTLLLATKQYFEVENGIHISLHLVKLWCDGIRAGDGDTFDEKV